MYMPSRRSSLRTRIMKREPPAKTLHPQCQGRVCNRLRAVGVRGRSRRVSAGFERCRSEGVMAGLGLDRDPAQLGEAVDSGLAAEAAVARRADAAERHLRLVV